MKWSVFISAVAIIAASCTPPLNQDPRTPTDILDAALIASQNEDWGTVETLLTPRLSQAVGPGTLPNTWRTLGDDPQMLEDTEIGRTAQIWVQGRLSLIEISQAVQVPPETLLEWLQTPDLEDPAYLQATPWLPALTLDDDSVLVTTRVTLYRQEEGWRIEVWQLSPLPGTEITAPVLPLDSDMDILPEPEPEALEAEPEESPEGEGDTPPETPDPEEESAEEEDPDLEEESNEEESPD
jgi:hypothetical protein